MSSKTEKFNQTQLKNKLPDIRPGDTVKVHQKIKETVKKGKKKEEKERIQVFEGVVLARKHGKVISATITVRKIIAGVGVEKIFPIHSPNIEKIEIIKRSKVRRAKLYYLRQAKGKKGRLKRKDFESAFTESSGETKKVMPEETKETKETGETKETREIKVKGEAKAEKEEKREEDKKKSAQVSPAGETKADKEPEKPKEEVKNEQ